MMEIVEKIFSIIGQHAFPIVVCVYLLYDKRRSDIDHKAEVDSLRESIVESNSKMVQALNNNTQALQRLMGE